MGDKKQQNQSKDSGSTDKVKSEKPAKEASQLSRGAMFDAVWIVLLYVGIIIRNAYYPVQMYDYYLGKTFPGVFDHHYLFIRVYMTRMANGHVPFALWRNLIFNMIREAMCFTYGRVLFKWDECGMHTVQGFMLDNAIKVVIYTVIFHYLPMSLLYRSKYFFEWVRAEYFIGFGFGNINYFNNLIHHYRGDIFVILFACTMQLNDRTGWEYVEDLIFGDMGMFHSGQFVSYFCYWIPFIYLYNAFLYREGWDLYLDLWPGYDHCKNPVSLFFNAQCRPRVYGVKEWIHYTNPRYNIHFVIFTTLMALFFSYGDFKDIRNLRAQEVSAKAIDPWLKKVKKD